MRKIKLIFQSLFLLPVRLFSKVSPLALIRNSKISKKSAILSGTRFYNSAIDYYSYIGRNCFISHTKIGRFCSIADNCSIGLATHPVTWVSTSPVFHSGKNILKTNFSDKAHSAPKHTIIENDVWIGMNACIMSGLNISTGAIIGAGAIVTKNVGAYEIWGGNPAKLIRKRFDEETIEGLINSKWWEWDDEKLENKAQYFDNPKGLLKQEIGE